MQLKTRLLQLTCGLAAMLVLGVGGVWTNKQHNILERFLFDHAQRSIKPSTQKQVVIISIDADSQSRLGSWPWPNSLHAKLMHQLHLAGTKAVVFTTPLTASNRNADIASVQAALQTLNETEHNIQDEKTIALRSLLTRSLHDLDDDQQLIRAIRAQGHVLLPIETSLEHSDLNTTQPSLPNLPGWPTADATFLKQARIAHVIQTPQATLLSAAKGFGHLVSEPDADGVMRHELAAVRIDQRILPALSIAAVNVATNQNDNTLHFDPNGISIKTRAVIALDDTFNVLIRALPVEGQGALTRYPYWSVLTGDVSANHLKDKVVVIGFTEGPNADRVHTSMGLSIPRTAVVASNIQSLLQGHDYHRPTWSIALQVVLAVTVVTLASWAVPTMGLLVSTGALLLLTGLLLWVETSLLMHTKIWLQLILPCAAALTPLIVMLVYTVTHTYITALHSKKSLTNNVDGLRTLGLTLQGQGQLDLAYETFRRCPMDTTTLDLLYRLGVDFERRRQMGKAAAVYTHIAKTNNSFRDAVAKSQQLAEQHNATQPAAARILATQKNEPQLATRPLPSRTKTTKETLGRYEIERQIGKGSMGVVYLGRDPKINRIVAIKAIPLEQEFEDTDLAEVRADFFREAEMAGRLNHPSIVTVYDAGETRGIAYIAMEFLKGEHLSFYTEAQHLLPVPKVLSLVARLADALDYAHRQNVIHRDIKPANIMYHIETDTLKITDFGIARLTDVSKTKTGIVLGTPSFMSPEQLDGGIINGRSDLFSLGVTLYHLLSAQLPFRADSMTKLMNKIATEPHTPIRSLRPELPACIEAVIDRALEKAEEHRYQSGAEMAEALRACIQATKKH